MDVTPLIPAGRQVVESYGDGQFRVTGVSHPGSVLVQRDRTDSWAIGSIAELSVASLAPLFVRPGWVEVLLLGCGPRLIQPGPAFRAELKALGVVVEPMDTGAACRTYNVLLSEDRRVAAALIAV